MVESSILHEKIGEIRTRAEKFFPEFQNREDFYAYVADHRDYAMDFEQAYADINNSLLPVFKAARDLCVYISQDQKYFKQGHVKHLYHMALVSRMVNKINDHCPTEEEKQKCIRLSDPHYGGMFYLQNGQKKREQNLFYDQSDRGFKDVIAKAVGCSYDDQLITVYFGALKEDVCPIYHDKPVCAANGSILNWEDMKDSTVLSAAVVPFVYEEVKKLCKKNNTSFSGYGVHYKQAEQNIQAKIDAFCDMKSKESVRNIQKGLRTTR